MVEEGGNLKMQLQKISQALDSYVRPQTFPVASRMISSTDGIPEKADGSMPGCSFSPAL